MASGDGNGAAKYRKPYGRMEWETELEQTRTIRATMDRLDQEDRYGPALESQAEPMVLGLVAGQNEFGTRDFQILVRYLLLDQDTLAKRAMSKGAFSLGKIEIVRKKKRSLSVPRWEPKPRKS